MSQWPACFHYLRRKTGYHEKAGMMLRDWWIDLWELHIQIYLMYYEMFYELFLRSYFNINNILTMINKITFYNYASNPLLWFYVFVYWYIVDALRHNELKDSCYLTGCIFIGTAVRLAGLSKLLKEISFRTMGGEKPQANLIWRSWCMRSWLNFGTCYIWWRTEFFCPSDVWDYKLYLNV